MSGLKKVFYSAAVVFSILAIIVGPAILRALHTETVHVLPHEADFVEVYSNYHGCTVSLGQPEFHPDTSAGLTTVHAIEQIDVSATRGDTTQTASIYFSQNSDYVITVKRVVYTGAQFDRKLGPDLINRYCGHMLRSLPDTTIGGIIQREIIIK